MKTKNVNSKPGEVVYYTIEESEDLVGNIANTVKVTSTYISSDEFLDNIEEFEVYTPDSFESYGHFE